MFGWTLGKCRPWLLSRRKHENAVFAFLRIQSLVVVEAGGTSLYGRAPRSFEPPGGNQDAASEEMPELTEAWPDYRLRLRAYIARRVGDRDAVDDLLHDVFVNAYEGRDKLRSSG